MAPAKPTGGDATGIPSEEAEGVARLLLEKYPSSRKKNPKMGITALHAACHLGARAEVLEILARRDPLASKRKGRKGLETPLHIACRYGAPAEAVRFLIKEFPGALEERDRNGRTPLQSACQEGNASADVVRLLIEGCPASLNDVDRSGRTLLHLACLAHGKIQAEVVRLLIQSNPECPREKDWYGRTPLHSACENGRASVPAEVVQLLIDGYPAALNDKDQGGRTPLHLVCLGHESARVDVVRLLIQNNPEHPGALREKYKDGAVPLHAVCASRNASVDVVRLISVAYPAALDEEDKKGFTPLDIAYRKRAPPDVLRYLIESRPEVIFGCRLNDLRGYIRYRELLEQLELLRALSRPSTSDEEASEIMTRFISTAWWGGVFLVLKDRPSLLHRLQLGEKTMLALLQNLGRRHHYMVGLAFEVLRSMPNLFKEAA